MTEGTVSVMSRRSNQKMKILCLSKILLEQTDRCHGMTLPEILTELSKYGIESGRKSLYDDMEALRIYGFDVRSKRDRYIRYYIQDRAFTLPELKMLCDLVANSSALTAKKRAELSKKVLEQGERFESNLFSAEGTEAATFGDDVYQSITLICEAITENKRISFKSFEWNARKQRILVNGGEVTTFSPWRLELVHGRYRLIGFDHSREATATIYPDRMVGVTVLSDQRLTGDSVLVERDLRTEPTTLRLKCDNALAGDVINRFGIDVTVLANWEDSFECSVKTLIDSELYGWIFTKCGQIRILSPEWAAEEYKRMLTGNICVAEE